MSSHHITAEITVSPDLTDAEKNGAAHAYASQIVAALTTEEATNILLALMRLNYFALVSGNHQDPVITTISRVFKNANIRLENTLHIIATA